MLRCSNLNRTEEELVFCVRCPDNGRSGSQRRKVRREELQEDVIERGWICDACADKKIRLQVLHFIANRIQATQTVPKDRNKFIFRELLQNADDVKADILVLRFEEDALYVANDGRAFTVHSSGNTKSDFDRLSQILGRHQEEDKEVVGHFGSGFQTVYSITNYPEVYSSGRHGRMNPCNEKWTWGIKSPHPHFNKSPYWKRKENKGALFRLPWRDNSAATEEVEGEKVWEDRNKWPRWDKQERRKMFDDLKGYIHQAIICCQHLKAVRLVWHEKDCSEAFQVWRDFCLRNQDTETLGMTCIKGSIQQGSLEFEERADKDQWEDSFQLENGWRWASDSCSFYYLIGKSNASEDGERLFLGKRNGLVTVTTDKGVLERELERGDLFVVLPLFDVSSVFDQEGLAYLYSVIPLPGLGKNRFIFSAHFWPTEDRKDVDVEGGGGEYGRWYRSLMLNVAELYERLFDQFLKELHGIVMTEETRQKVILNSLPATSLSEWMRPGKENQQEWLRQSQERFNELLLSLTRKPILFSNGKWIEPVRAYWAQDDEEKAVFEIMGAIAFTDAFISHDHFKALSETLSGRKIDIAKFNNLWGEFVATNKNALGHLVYDQHLKNGKTLDKRAVDNLIGFCIIGNHASLDTLSRAVVPGRDLVLRKLEEYPVLPDELEFLQDILPGSKVIHDDFLSKELLLVYKEKFRALEGNQVIFLIDDMVQRDPARFENLNEKDHLLLSRTLRTLVDTGWGPTNGLRNCKFIPYKQGNKVSLGTLNVRRAKGDSEWISSQSTKEHVERYYQRESIFGVQKLEVPGLTPEVMAKIRFLSLLECDDETTEKVEGALSLVKLMAQGGKPLNFVLHFLSPMHNSLFVDFVLESYLGIQREQLSNQKKQFQEALKVYFKEEHKGEENLTRKDMAKVPCLYDEQGNWFNAGDFAQDLEPGMNILGYKSLHEDLRQWPRDTLNALGVDPSPNCSRIVETIMELATEKEKSRGDLGYIIFWLLTSEAPIGAEFDSVKNLLWVPTVDHGFRQPKDVLITTAENKKILGDDFGGFLDCSGFQDKTVNRIQTWQSQKTKDRAQSLGLKVEPGLCEMLSVVEAKRKAGVQPPAELFGALSIKVGLDERRAHELIWGKNLGYCLNGSWMDSNQIRIMDANIIPKEIRDTMVILPTLHPHAHYLIADGASNELLPEDILRPLLDKRLQSSTVVWDMLRNVSSADPSYFEEEYKKLYGEAPIYPIGEHQACPKDIICIEDDVDDAFLKEGAIGKWRVLGRQLTQRHGEVLKKLGARRGSDLTSNAIIDLIRSQKDYGATLNEADVSSILRLIRRIVDLDQQVFPEEALWPAERGGQLIWEKPIACYIRDSPLCRYFEDDLSYICLRINGVPDELLAKYAETSQCRRFSSYVRKEGSGEAENCREDPFLTGVFKEMEKALALSFGSFSNCFRWLGEAQAASCDELVSFYSIANTAKKVERFALAEKSSSKWLISNVKLASAKMYSHLAEEITNVCLQEGFPEDSRRDKLQLLVLNLLMQLPSEWHDLVAGYEHRGSQLTSQPSPILLIDELFGIGEEDRDPGWIETKGRLQYWYGCCQICNYQTPRDEYGYTTEEVLTKVIRKKGGKYRLPMSEHDPGLSVSNSLLLCPRHYVLWVRGLVKFPDFDEEKEIIPKLNDLVQDLEEEEKKNPEGFRKWSCRVFEGTFELGKYESSVDARSRSRSSWQDGTMDFTTEHLVSFLKNMRDHFEKNKDI